MLRFRYTTSVFFCAALGASTFASAQPVPTPSTADAAVSAVPAAQSADAAVVEPAAQTATPAPDGQDSQQQQRTAAELEMGRRYFEAGVAAMGIQDWAEGYRALERSWQVRRTASVALNMGVCLMRLGRLVEARVSFQHFNDMATPEQHRQHDGDVGRWLGEIGRNVARVRVNSIVPATARITMDGQPLVLNEARESSLDPNVAHTLRAEAEGFIPIERNNTLPNAGVWDVSLALRVVAPTTTASTPVTQRWWFWTIIGATAAGAAAAVVGFVLRPTADLPGTTHGVFSAITAEGVRW